MRLTLITTLLLIIAGAAHSADSIDEAVLACLPGMTKETVDGVLAKAGAGRWRSLSNSLQVDGPLSADLVEVSPWEHLVLTYRPTHDPHGQGNLDRRDELVSIARHHFSELLRGMQPDLVERITAIQGVGRIGGYNFDPGPLIACTNLLRGAGEVAALSAMRAYLDIETTMPRQGYWGFDVDGERVILVARLLYGGPDHPLPPPGLGGPCPDLSRDERLTPIFPLLVLDDIPFLAVNGYVLGGQPEPASMHLELCRSAGIFRATDLAPTRSPISALDELLDSHAWKGMVGTDMQAERDARNMLRAQAMRCLQQALPKLDAEAYLSTACCGKEEEAKAVWVGVAKQVADAGVRWNAEAQRFTK